MCTIGRIKSSEPYLLNDLLANDADFQREFINLVITKGFDSFGTLLVFHNPNYGNSPKAYKLQKLSAATIDEFLQQIKDAISANQMLNLKAIYFYGRATPETEDDSLDKLDYYIQPVEISEGWYFLYHGLVESVKLDDKWLTINEAFDYLQTSGLIDKVAPKVDTLVLQYLFSKHLNNLYNLPYAIKGNYVFLVFNPVQGAELVINHILQLFDARHKQYDALEILIDYPL